VRDESVRSLETAATRLRQPCSVWCGGSRTSGCAGRSADDTRGRLACPRVERRLQPRSHRPSRGRPHFEV